MVLSIPCGDTAIRVYDRPSRKASTSKVEYRAAFHERTGLVSKSPPGKRLWGTWATSIRSTVAGLLPRLKLEQEQIDAVWANEQIVSEVIQPAMSHMWRILSGPTAVVFFQKRPFEGIVQHKVRKKTARFAWRLVARAISVWIPTGMIPSMRRSRTSKKSASRRAGKYRLCTTRDPLMRVPNSFIKFFASTTGRRTCLNSSRSRLRLGKHMPRGSTAIIN